MNRIIAILATSLFCCQGCVLLDPATYTQIEGKTKYPYMGMAISLPFKPYSTVKYNPSKAKYEKASEGCKQLHLSMKPIRTGYEPIIKLRVLAYRITESNYINSYKAGKHMISCWDHVMTPDTGPSGKKPEMGAIGEITEVKGVNYNFQCVKLMFRKDFKCPNGDFLLVGIEYLVFKAELPSDVEKDKALIIQMLNSVEVYK